MKRRTFLATATISSCAGCITVEWGGSEEPATVGDRQESESTETTEEGPDPSEQPIIHELSLDSDSKWLMMARRYEVPNAGDEFTVTEQWHITDADGATVLEKEREEVVETEREIESVLVSGGTWYIPRWDYNIQQGEYTVELAVVGANGSESDSERRSITIETEPTE